MMHSLSYRYEEQVRHREGPRRDWVSFESTHADTPARIDVVLVNGINPTGPIFLEAVNNLQALLAPSPTPSTMRRACASAAFHSEMTACWPP